MMSKYYYPIILLLAPLPVSASPNMFASIEALFIAAVVLLLFFILSIIGVIKASNKTYQPEKPFSFLLLPSFFYGVLLIYLGQVFGFDKDFKTFMNIFGFICCITPILIFIKRVNKR